MMGIKTTTTWGETQAKRLDGGDYSNLQYSLRLIQVADYSDIMRATGEGRGNRLTSAPSGRVTSVPHDDDGAADVAADIAAERDEAREAAQELESERDAAIEALAVCENAVDGLSDVVERLIAEIVALLAKYDSACDDVARLEDELDRAREALQEVRNG